MGVAKISFENCPKMEKNDTYENLNLKISFTTGQNRNYALQVIVLNIVSLKSKERFQRK